MERRTNSGSGAKYRLSGTSRSYASRQAMKNRKAKKPKRRHLTGLIVGAVAITAVITGIAWGTSKVTKKKASPSEAVKIEETALKASVKIDDIDITGMSRTEAHDAVMKKYEWGMTANYNGEVYNIKNIIEEELNKILDDVFTGTPKESYTIQFTGLDTGIDEQIEEIAKKWEVKAKNASLVSFNKETNEFLYQDGSDGVEINRDELRENIKKAIEEKNFKASLAVTTKITKPEIATKEQVKDMYKVIGTFTTNTTSNKDRNTNIDLASRAIDGVILAPGEEFSFNNTTGNRTLEKGYRPAGAYLNGKLVEEPGGGVCQVSSTLYNAVIFAGIETTERHAHSFEPNYVNPGEDAMVSYDGYAGPDMKFVNTSKVSVVLRAKLVDQKLTISVVGIPILADDEKVYMSSKKTGEYDEPTPEYVDDGTLGAGQEVVVKSGTKGSRWETNIVHKKGEKVLSDKLLHYSTYRGKAGTVKKNLALAGIAVPSSGSSTDISGGQSQASDASGANTSTGASVNPGESTVETKAHTESASKATKASEAKTKETKAEKKSSTPGETIEMSSGQAPTAAPSTAAPTTADDGTIEQNPGN